MKKIRVGIVNYLNTKPLLYGIKRSPIFESIELVEGHPSRIASALINGEIDLGLVPVTLMRDLQPHYLVSDYCIGCDGEVASVCIFSEVPIDQVTEVMLDYQSRTSVELAGILLKEYWKVSPRLVAASADYRKSIKGTTAGLVIGDRSFEQRNISPYVYDLGKAWKALTGLPFVFAAWISNKELPQEFIHQFNLANGIGLAKIPEVLEETPSTLFDLEDYYTRCIRYELDEAKQKALATFLSKIQDKVIGKHEKPVGSRT